MTDQMKKLQAYGVNPSETMERFVGDEELYLDCLLSFMSDPSFEGLKKALAAQDDSAAFEHAHTLKGVAGNLGLSPLYTAICNMVESLRVHDTSNAQQQYATIMAEKQSLEQVLEL